ncbi:hypothetical protein AB0D74_02720 [Streptomyces sp. NPDC048278]|uniref:hypothetical protein n=1 Tax=Streptomyces sp. NPDC048278 TaxID=3155809 RepID=UPI0034311422
MRVFTWRREQGRRPGLPFVQSTGRLHGAESMEKARFLLALDFAGEVTDVVSQPFRMRFGGAVRERPHTPDYPVRTRTGDWLIDVRPTELIFDRDRQPAHEIRADRGRPGTRAGPRRRSRAPSRPPSFQQRIARRTRTGHAGAVKPQSAIKRRRRHPTWKAFSHDGRGHHAGQQLLDLLQKYAEDLAHQIDDPGTTAGTSSGHLGLAVNSWASTLPEVVG